MRANIKDHIRSIRAERPGPDVIRDAVEILNDGGLVAYPTRCMYGLGADARNSSAVERIFTLKRRPASKPLLVLVPDVDAIAALVRTVPPAGTRIMEHFWPGKITIVFPAAESLPAGLTAGSGKIGIRLPGHPVARALVEAFAGPLTGTSANLSGRLGCRRIEQLPPELLQRIDLVLDAGPLKGGVGSTVVDVTGEVPVILREGEVLRGEIERIMTAH